MSPVGIFTSCVSRWTDNSQIHLPALETLRTLQIVIRVLFVFWQWVTLFYFIGLRISGGVGKPVCFDSVQQTVGNSFGYFFPSTHQHKLIYQSQTDNNFCVMEYNPDNDHDIVVYRGIYLGNSWSLSVKSSVVLQFDSGLLFSDEA